MHITPMDEAAAAVVAAWQYEGDLSMYSMAGEEDIAYLSDPANGYYAIREAGDLVGYCCFGPDARVPGGDYTHDAVDIGMGLPPEGLGKGTGTRLLPAIMAFAEETFTPAHMRATVAAFNARARQLCRSAGFEELSTFERKDGRAFVVYLR